MAGAGAVLLHRRDGDPQRSRAKAEKPHSDAKFNIRAFHDAVLELGSVPMSEVDRMTDRFIASGGVGPYPDEE